MPPELLLSSRQDEHSDVYSLAMTIYALGVQSEPFDQLSDAYSVASAVERGKRPSKCDSLGGLTSNETDKLWSLITKMWHHESWGRPTATHARDTFIQEGLSLSPSCVIQHAIRLPRHLYVNHSEYFTFLSPTSVTSLELALDDVRLFRSNLLLLSPIETAPVITSIQEVRHTFAKQGLFTLNYSHPTVLLSVSITASLTERHEVRNSNFSKISAPFPANFPRHIGLQTLPKGT